MISEAIGDDQFRTELLRRLRLRPCHITGEHDPTHTARYICAFQIQSATNCLLRSLGISASDLPREAHGDDCHHCCNHEAVIAHWVAEGVVA